MENLLDEVMLKNQEHDASIDDAPKIGRLFIGLASAVSIIVVLTFAAEAYYTP